MNLQDKSILDWGCGPGRTLIHLADLNPKMNIFGTDYNEKYVQWCTNNITRVTVTKNELTPPLSYSSETFHAIYGISIFTHLSLEMHHAWMTELHRVLVDEGLLLLTTHGEASKRLLHSKQIEQFNKGKLVTQKYKVEGNRLYAAYQPKVFFENLATSSGFQIIQHTEGKIVNKKIQQDIWLLKRVTL